ncbi:3'-5' exonuclease [Alteromonas sp. D210916BOD_24]|uniref:3'-5' exonuclease n=1 Tax=Alteromonas sp. D210916BOD_24 TaxID=3157618 RepID=UPI00399C568C
MAIGFLQRLLAVLGGSSTLKTKLKAMTFSSTSFCAVDFELTSLDPNSTHITSIGYVSGKRGRVDLSSCGYHVVNTEAELGQSPVIHGLTLEVLNEGTSLESAIEALQPLLRSSVLVFHNASLDLKALDRAFRVLNLPPQEVIYIDTLQLALYQLNKQHQVLPNNSATLTVCRQRLDLPTFPEHNALDDALATLQLLFAQQEQLGISQNESLSALLHTKSVGIYQLGVN